MECLTVTYPIGEDTTFDHEYYRDSHMPLCARLFTEHGYRGSVMRSNQGTAPGSGDLNYVSVDLLFDSKEQLGAALAAGGQEVSADVVNYTNAVPSMTFGEVAVDLV
ncbi:MAG: EthD family reductase [Halioglobus sp.]